MDYIYDASVSPSLRLRAYLNSCPHCSGVDFKLLEQHQHKLNELCYHCQYEYRKYLQFKYEVEDVMQKLHKQRRARLRAVRQAAA